MLRFEKHGSFAFTMSDAAPINPSHTSTTLNRVNGHVSRRPASGEAPSLRSRSGDAAEISDRAALLSRLSEIPVIRIDAVDRARGLLAAGALDTPERLDQALDALLSDVHGEG